MDYLQLSGKRILIFGVANRRSVAWHVAQQLQQVGAECVYVVRDDSLREGVEKLTGASSIYTCNVESEDEIRATRDAIASDYDGFDGLVHSLAFADYSAGMQPFHDTPKKAFLQAVDISCFSLVAVSRAMKDLLRPDASVVTISISTTRMASESYGYMAPIKAALDSTVVFLAKSFSRFSRVRFNAVAPGLLKTAASAGIPGYIDAYLYAEQVIPRRQAVRTEEAASAVVYLLSPRSSGINAQKIVVDAGMSINYFDADIVGRATGQ